VGWISALPWNQAPVELRDRSVEQLPACSDAHPGVRAAAEKMLVHGKEYLCVLGYSARFASEQLHSLSTTLAKVTQNLRRLASELSKPQARFTEQRIRDKISRWLTDSFVREVLHYELQRHQEGWQLSFQVDNQALQQLWSQRLGRTVLLTNRLDWPSSFTCRGWPDFGSRLGRPSLALATSSELRDSDQRRSRRRRLVSFPAPIRPVRRANATD
jgi:hypothetical protein